MLLLFVCESNCSQESFLSNGNDNCNKCVCRSPPLLCSNSLQCICRCASYGKLASTVTTLPLQHTSAPSPHTTSTGLAERCRTIQAHVLAAWTSRTLVNGCWLPFCLFAFCFFVISLVVAVAVVLICYSINTYLHMYIYTYIRLCHMNKYSQRCCNAFAQEQSRITAWLWVLLFAVGCGAVGFCVGALLVFVVVWHCLYMYMWRCLLWLLQCFGCIVIQTF